MSGSSSPDAVKAFNTLFDVWRVGPQPPPPRATWQRAALAAGGTSPRQLAGSDLRAVRTVDRLISRSFSVGGMQRRSVRQGRDDSRPAGHEIVNSKD